MFQTLGFMLDFQTGHQISNVFLQESIRSIIQTQNQILWKNSELCRSKMSTFMANNNTKEVTIYLALLNNNLDLANMFSDCSIYILSCLLSLTESTNTTIYDPILKISLSSIRDIYLKTIITVFQSFNVGL